MQGVGGESLPQLNGRLRELALLSQKTQANQLVAQAVRRGELVPAAVCERCGKPPTPGGIKKRLDAHHADYSRPLDVEWLCHSCHRREHQAGRRDPRSPGWSDPPAGYAALLHRKRIEPGYRPLNLKEWLSGAESEI